MLTPVLFILGAYLLGAVPFGLLIGLARGVDIRTQGSRNIGATNAGRVLGKRWGYLCLALDIVKGFAPSLAASLHFGAAGADYVGQLVVLAVAVAAVVGHVFPIYLGFRGGKGVATTIGVALGIWPHFSVAMGVALLGYAAGRYATGAVSVGSLSLAAVFPVALIAFTLIRGEPLSARWPMIAVAALLAAVIVVRHRENIARLLKGSELKAGAAPNSPRDSAV